MLTAVWGENEESKNAFAEKCGIDCFADTPADMADKIDAVLITLSATVRLTLRLHVRL